MAVDVDGESGTALARARVDGGRAGVVAWNNAAEPAAGRLWSFPGSGPGEPFTVADVDKSFRRFLWKASICSQQPGSAGNVAAVTESGFAMCAAFDVVQRLLVEAGPMTEGELLDAVLGEGVDLGEDPADTLAEVLDSEGLPFVLPLIDGRQVLLSTLLAGRVFTHRLGAVEVGHDFLAVTPDLAPLSMLLEGEPYRSLEGRGWSRSTPCLMRGCWPSGACPWTRSRKGVCFCSRAATCAGAGSARET
jgi:hypothetical protein